jgi:predicted enzyme related to lactoylglutathione lyase
MKPAYFDFTVKDLAKARTFFEHVFDWRFEKFPMPYDDYRIQAGAEQEPGLGWFAACAEPGGLLFGVMEADPDAR